MFQRYRFQRALRRMPTHHYLAVTVRPNQVTATIAYYEARGWVHTGTDEVIQGGQVIGYILYFEQITNSGASLPPTPGTPKPTRQTP
jgi:hypothetical protein